MKLDGYKLLEETDEHYRLDSGDGKPFRVAKKGLGKGTIERIAQHFAHGGVVGAMQDATMDTLPLDFSTPMAAAPVQDPAQPDLSAFSFAMPEGQAPLRNVPLPTVQAPVLPTMRPSQPTPEDLALLNGQSLPPKPAPAPVPEAPATVPMPAPGGRRTLPVPVGELTPDQRIQLGIGVPQYAPAPEPQAAPPPPPMPTAGPGTGGSGVPSFRPSGPMPGQAQMESAVRMQADAAKGQADAEMKLREQQAQEIAELQQKRQQFFDAQQQRSEALKSEILSSRIDPNRLWGSRTTGQKMGGIVGIILSGIGQGLAGGPNMAMQVLDKAIDADIDAQKANLENKKGLLAFHSQETRDGMANFAATKADMYDAFAAQLQKAAGQFAGQKAEGAAQQAIGEIQVKADQWRSQAAQLKFDQWYKAQQVAIEKAKLGAGAGDGLSAKDKEALVETESRYRNINGNLDSMLKLIDADGTYEALGAHNTKLHQHITTIANDAAKISDPGSANREAEVEMWKGVLGNPGFWSKNSTVEAALTNFRAMVEQRRNIAYQVRGLGAMVPPPSLTPGRK